MPSNVNLGGLIGGVQAAREGYRQARNRDWLGLAGTVAGVAAPQYATPIRLGTTLLREGPSGVRNQIRSEIQGIKNTGQEVMRIGRDAGRGLHDLLGIGPNNRMGFGSRGSVPSGLAGAQQNPRQSRGGDFVGPPSNLSRYSMDPNAVNMGPPELRLQQHLGGRDYGRGLPYAGNGVNPGAAYGRNPVSGASVLGQMNAVGNIWKQSGIGFVDHPQQR